MRSTSASHQYNFNLVSFTAAWNEALTNRALKKKNIWKILCDILLYYISPNKVVEYLDIKDSYTFQLKNTC